MICFRLYNDPLNFYNLYNMSPKILQYLKNMTLWLDFCCFLVFLGGHITVCTNGSNSCLFSGSVMSGSLQPHGLQHIRFPSPSLSPKVCSNSHPLSQWCHPTITSSVVSSSCLQSFQVSGSFSVSQLFASDGQSIHIQH